MTRIERFRGRSGNTIEVRYQTDMRGIEFLDEIVTENVHAKILSDSECWANIDGLRVTWWARGDNKLCFHCGHSNCTPLPEETNSTIPK